MSSLPPIARHRPSCLTVVKERNPKVTVAAETGSPSLPYQQPLLAQDTDGHDAFTELVRRFVTPGVQTSMSRVSPALNQHVSLYKASGPAQERPAIKY